MLKYNHYVKTSRGKFELKEKVKNEITGEVFNRHLCTLDSDDLVTILLDFQNEMAGKCKHTWLPADLKRCSGCGHVEPVKRQVPRRPEWPVGPELIEESDI